VTGSEYASIPRSYSALSDSDTVRRMTDTRGRAEVRSDDSRIWTLNSHAQFHFSPPGRPGRFVRVSSRCQIYRTYYDVVTTATKTSLQIATTLQGSHENINDIVYITIIRIFSVKISHYVSTKVSNYIFRFYYLLTFITTFLHVHILQWKFAN